MGLRRSKAKVAMLNISLSDGYVSRRTLLSPLSHELPGGKSKPPVGLLVCFCVFFKQWVSPPKFGGRDTVLGLLNFCLSPGDGCAVGSAGLWEEWAQGAACVSVGEHSDVAWKEVFSLLYQHWWCMGTNSLAVSEMPLSLASGWGSTLHVNISLNQRQWLGEISQLLWKES